MRTLHRASIGKDTDGTTDLTAATAGDMARYDGTDWIKIINVVGSGGGGGGGGSTDRIVLLDGVTYSPGAARNFNLTAAIEARHLLTFMIDGRPMPTRSCSRTTSWRCLLQPPPPPLRRRVHHEYAQWQQYSPNPEPG